jgi:hypothetical protein
MVYMGLVLSIVSGIHWGFWNESLMNKVGNLQSYTKYGEIPGLPNRVQPILWLNPNADLWGGALAFLSPIKRSLSLIHRQSLK